MVERAVVVGPGTLRVGQFIGRLGIVPMPAIEHGLGLVPRVVRRHVAKLQSVGWCERMPAVRGDGMLVWMTASGLDGVDLSELPALRAPKRFSGRTTHAVRAAWAAAELQRGGREWIAGREMALTPSRWATRVANERGGYSPRLPDLAFWSTPDDTTPVAVIVVGGPPKPRRDRAALRGWQRAIASGQYAQIHYLARPAAAGRFQHMADQIGLPAAQFIADDHIISGDPPSPADVVEQHAEPQTRAPTETVAPAAPDTPRPAAPHPTPGPATSEPPARTPEQDAERERLLRQLLGQDEPAPRRRWRRRSG